MEDEERVQTKLYKKQQADMDKLATFVRVNRANGVANSAKSKKKVLEKVEANAVERPNTAGDTRSGGHTPPTHASSKQRANLNPS